MKKFAVLLSGCGVFDGAEIHEATLSLLAIAKQGGSYEIFAPDIQSASCDQPHHRRRDGRNPECPGGIGTNRPRPDIRDLKQFNPASFDGLLLPGGFGAAKNLSTWAFEGADASILPEVEEAIRGMVP